MRKARGIDFARLLGFETLGERISDGIDFRDESIANKLGAKVGAENFVVLDLAFALTSAAPQPTS